MENGGGIAEDALRPGFPPRDDEYEFNVEVASSPKPKIADADNVPESKPVTKDSAVEEAMDERDVTGTSPQTPLAPLHQQVVDEQQSEDSQIVILESIADDNLNGLRVSSDGEELRRREGGVASPGTNLERPIEPDVERDDALTAGKGLGDVDDGAGGDGAKRETGEISLALIDDAERRSNGRTDEMDGAQISSSSSRHSLDEGISADGVKNREDNDGSQQIVVDGNGSMGVLDYSTADSNYNQEPDKCHSSDISTTIGSSSKQPSSENEKVTPQDAPVERVSIAGLDCKPSYASGFSSERDDGKEPVAAALKLHEGEQNRAHSSDEASKNQEKCEQEEGKKPDMKSETGNVANQDDSEALRKPRATEGSVDLPTRSHPAGLGSSSPLPESATRSVQQPKVSGSVSRRQTQLSEDVGSAEAEEYDETREKLQMIRVKFLRLAHRLGQTPHNVVVAQVLYRLGLAEQLRGSMNTSRAGAFSFDRASAMAEQLEAAGQEPLDFSCTIMVIGKTGVGKSATINSIFDETKFKTDPFRRGTTKIQDITSTVQGIKLRVIDTPGLSPSSTDQPKNERILHSVKHFIKNSPPDVVMYLDRLDMQNRDLGDVPLLRTITNVFGPSIWFNAIVVLTHAASAPPDGQNGVPLSYEMYVTQRSHVIQQAVRQAAADPRLLNPVSLVENHSACRMNRAGQRVLPNGQVWKPHLLLLSFASKILTEANALLKLQDSPVGRPFAARSRAPPLPFFLSSLLQTRTHLKLPQEQQFADEDYLDVDTDEEPESEDECDYDELPPFKSLTKEQLNGLNKFQRKAYYEELDYREKLFYKKQMKEEKKRRMLLKKMATAAMDLPDDHNNNAVEEESGGPASVPVPMPDLALPASFDSDYPSHRYRFLDSSNQWLVRPVLETQGWDHDVGYEGLNVEKLFAVKEKIPVSLSGQLTKDKKDCTLQMEIASSLKHGEGKGTSLSMDMQTVGKDLAYTFRGETQFTNLRRNSTSAGVSATLLGDSASAGIKVEDILLVKKRLKLLVAGGAMTGRGEVAYGGRIEATLRSKDYPLSRALSTLALSLVDWHGDLAVGCNLQSQIPLGRHANVTGHANLSNRGTGQVGIRINSSEQLQLALIALIPIFRNARKFLFGSSESI